MSTPRSVDSIYLKQSEQNENYYLLLIYHNVLLSHLGVHFFVTGHLIFIAFCWGTLYIQCKYCAGSYIYGSVYFAKCINPFNPHPYQEIKHFYCPGKPFF